MIGQYWGDYTKQMDAFRNGDATVGTTWQVITNLLQGEDPAVAGRRHQADRGRDRLVRHLDDQLEDQAPELRLQVHRPHRLARGQRPDRRVVRRGAGQLEGVRAGGRPRATASIFHADDDAFWKDVWYWKTPEAKCVDGRTDVTCKDFDDWVKAWTEIKG